MIPVRVDVAEIVSSLSVTETILELRSQNERFRSEAFDVIAHFLPVIGFNIVKESGKIGKSLRRV